LDKLDFTNSPDRKILSQQTALRREALTAVCAGIFHPLLAAVTGLVRLFFRGEGGLLLGVPEFFSFR
jgi:hypothetical protein